MIFAGAFGKVFQGTLKTPSPGSNGATQRDVAVKTLKSECYCHKWYESCDL